MPLIKYVDKQHMEKHLSTGLNRQRLTKRSQGEWILIVYVFIVQMRSFGILPTQIDLNTNGCVFYSQFWGMNCRISAGNSEFISISVQLKAMAMSMQYAAFFKFGLFS